MIYPGKAGLYDPKFEHDACGIGLIANIDGHRTHGLVQDAISILFNLTHRGGAGSEPETGDGAGLLIQLPHEFFRASLKTDGINLPERGEYGVAMMFGSPEEEKCRRTVDLLCKISGQEGIETMGVRIVPINPAPIGKTANAVCPGIRQVFLKKPEGISEDDFERKLYVVSKIAQRTIRYAASNENRDLYFYLTSISCRTIVYKGMLRPDQLSAFYLDLKDIRTKSALALVHSRFSTNTFPSWERAHPMNYLIHNGEINTIRGNVNWVKAREAMLRSDLFGADLRKVMPVINEDGADSAMLDDFVRLLVHSGISLPEAMIMAIPEPWENGEHMDPKKRAFYEYTSCMMEAWDGPAAIAFTDGRIAGALLDRNGLRPSRICETTDGMIIMSSETGTLHLPAERVKRRDRLRPGKMLLIDTEQGRIISDEEIKSRIASARPYQKWLDQYLIRLADLPEPVPAEKSGSGWLDVIREMREKISPAPYEQAMLKDFTSLELLMANKENEVSSLPLLNEQKLYGYTYEDLELTIKTIANTGEDPVASMGVDTPLAVLSNRPQLLYSYFKQLFAQVTNPPIDAIREHIVTSSRIQIGSEGNLLDPKPENCRMICHDTPVLTRQELTKLKAVKRVGFASVSLPMLFNIREENGLRHALEDLFKAADFVMDSGYNIIILSDKGASERKVPIPALLAVSALHHDLVRKGTRTRISIVCETGEAREAHHLALLVGYGANAVCPYLAYRTIESMAEGNGLQVSAEEGIANYRESMTNAIVKIMSKMGISTVRSYHGAQIFEALGVSNGVIEKYFTGTTSRIAGITLKEIEREIRERHAKAFDVQTRDEPLEAGGDYKWRRNGEYHLYNPENIFLLQQSCRTGNYDLFKEFSAAVNMRTTQLKNIRGLLRIVEAVKPIPIDTVEPASSIIKRFKTGAMSFGSISREAHECIAIAMNRLGGKSNTGEGGEPADRYLAGEDGVNRNSAVKQVASARFGVTLDYLNSAQEIQIKIAQGAKPGEGGHLPGSKVYPWIAKARYSTPGVELISPPPHHDIYSIEDLAQLIRDLKAANKNARISVKLVSEGGVGTIAVGVAKALADVIVVSGYDGGTGAAPRTSIRHAGLPWELGIAEAHQSLLMNNMRNRVVLETDGKLLTGRDIVIAALLGAEEFAFATAPLVVLGCDMMRACNLDTCPVGIATQNPVLKCKFRGKPEYIENLMRFLAQEVREWMSRIGVRSMNELIGHVELLHQTSALERINEKAKTVDLQGLLYQPTAVDSAKERYFTQPQDHALWKTLDQSTLISLCEGAIKNLGEKADYSLGITNRNRTVGCMLSAEIVRRHGPSGLPDGSVHLRFEGSAGLSFGAFLTKGVEMELHGDANDYLAKGLSGGRIVVVPPDGSTFEPSENIIIGNVALYGATSGEVYIRGIAGERFCVRNSGATAVSEGVGNHCCEYMTGGTVVVLGETGRNFAAGMSGGVAYVLDEAEDLESHVNKGMVSVKPLDNHDEKELKAILKQYAQCTGSDVAKKILKNFKAQKHTIKKVIPDAYDALIAERRNHG